jgi:hypothetical protein
LLRFWRSVRGENGRHIRGDVGAQVGQCRAHRCGCRGRLRPQLSTAYGRRPPPAWIVHSRIAHCPDSARR